jgi:hypothetical protein
MIVYFIGRVRRQALEGPVAVGPSDRPFCARSRPMRPAASEQLALLILR